MKVEVRTEIGMIKLDEDHANIVRRRLANTRHAFYSTFSVEINHLRAFMNEYPFLTLGLFFFLGLIVGGVLRASISQFAIITLVGGSSLAILYGLNIGLPVIVSSLATVPVLLFTTYATVRILWAIEKYPGAAQYLAGLKKKYRPGARFLAVHAGKIGVGGALALCTLLIGWWVGVVIAYILDVDVKTTMKSAAVGLLIAAVLSWASYEGLSRWLPNPLIVTAIVVIIFAVIVRVVGMMVKREPASRKKEIADDDSGRGILLGVAGQI